MARDHDWWAEESQRSVIPLEDLGGIVPGRAYEWIGLSEIRSPVKVVEWYRRQLLLRDPCHPPTCTGLILVLAATFWAVDPRNKREHPARAWTNLCRHRRWTVCRGKVQEAYEWICAARTRRDARVKEGELQEVS